MNKLILLLMVRLLASCQTLVIVEEDLLQIEVIEPVVILPKVVGQLPEIEDIIEGQLFV